MRSMGISTQETNGNDYLIVGLFNLIGTLIGPVMSGKKAGLFDWIKGIFGGKEKWKYWR